MVGAMFSGLNRLPAERLKDLVAELTSPWSPAGVAEETRFATTLRRASANLRSTFKLPDAVELGPSQQLVGAPDGRQVWQTNLMFMARPFEPKKDAASALLAIWK